MPRRPASVTQSSIARALRAAQQIRARAVRIEPDGTIVIDPTPAQAENPQIAKERLAAKREAVF